MQTTWSWAAFTALWVAVSVSQVEAVSRQKASLQPTVNTARDSLQRIFAAENQRNGKDPFLASAIHHSQPVVRQAALYAIGRIGEASLIGELSDLLNKRRGPNKVEAIFALSLIPDENALTILVQHLAMQQDPQVLAELYTAIGRAGGEKNVPLFASALQNTANPNILEGVCYGLGQLWAKDSEAWSVPTGLIANLIQRVKQSESLAVACGFALSRFRGLPSQIPPGDAVKVAETTKSREAQIFLIRMLAKVQTAPSTAFLIQKAAQFSPVPLRIEAIKSLGQHAFSKPILACLKSALEAPQTAVVIQALDSIQAFTADAKEVSPKILELYRSTSSRWLQSKALRVGMLTDPLLWKPVALLEINNDKSENRAAAAAALSITPSLEEAPLISTLVQDTNPRVVIDVLESLGAWPEGAFTEQLKTAMLLALERKDPAVVASIAPIVERHKWKSFGAPLALAFQAVNKPDLVESKVAVLTALGSLGDSSAVPIFEAALKDPERMVAMAAADALKESTSRDESAQVPSNSKSPAFAFSGAEVEEAARTTVTLKTTRGDIQIRMAKQAPLSALHFVRLVRKKFYDGLTFHRVVPDFVAQGGDPRGDGFGGPGYLIRDEVSPLLHKRGTIGLATSGKDTGGSQFFINLASNFHLDGRYTVFGEVINGIEIADKLEVGDKILSARVQK